MFQAESLQIDDWNKRKTLLYPSNLKFLFRNKKGVILIQNNHWTVEQTLCLPPQKQKWSTSDSWMILRSYASPKTDILRNPNLLTGFMGRMSAVEQQQQQQQQQTWVQLGGSKGSCTADL